MSKREESARVLCNALFAEGKGVDEIMTALETEFGDNFARLQRGSKTVIVWVYEDSRPNYELYAYPQG